MAGAHGLASIEKLSENNYEIWKIQMKSVLIYNDLWAYIQGTEIKTEQNAQEWERRDSKALALINLSITPGQLNHVKRAQTSEEAWNTLQQIFESRGPVRKTALYKQLIKLEKKPEVSITQHMNDFSSIAEKLEEAGIELPEEILSIMLLASLPTEYENFSVVIESRDEMPPLENLKIKLKEEEARQAERKAKYDLNENKSDALLIKGQDKRDRPPWANQRSNNGNSNRGPFKNALKCYTCGKTGHKSSVCRSKHKGNAVNNKSDAMLTVASNTQTMENTDAWCIDSGATRHMCNDKQKFEIINNNEQSKVYTATKSHAKSTGTGDVTLKVQINRRENSVKLKDTMCVPDLRNNLLSVASATNNGYSVIFKKHHAIVKRENGSIALTATRQGNLYVVDETKQSAMFTNNNDKFLTKWHQRFGHLNVSDLTKMKNNNMVSGMDLEGITTSLECTVCARCKITRKPFKSSNNREKTILGLVHSDICGPMNTESLGGAKYFVTFIDDHTRYTEVAMLRNKSDVLEAFKKYKRKVENYTGKRIKMLRTDNGGEFLSSAFTKFLEEEGVSRQLSVEYTPQQNGVAERANRTLVEMARCMKLQAKLPDSLWAEMIHTSVYLRNRCATKSLEDKTPLEAWTGRKPYVGFFRTIGSKVIALNKRHNRKKFLPKGDEYVMVGYSDESKAYRIWKRGTKTVIKARDVKFFESIESDENPTKDVLEMPGPEEENNDENIEGTDQETTEGSVTNQGECGTTRGRGRPKIVRTGERGRPRKVYHTVPNNHSSSTHQNLTDLDDPDIEPRDINEAITGPTRQR